MTELLESIHPWWTLSMLVGAFGFAPGFILRLLVKIYPREDPRRAELISQLYVLRRFERPFFVAEQLETVLLEGVPHRISARRQRRSKSDRNHTSGTRDGIRSTLRKITVTAVLGAVTFPLTQLLFTELPGQIAMATIIGGFVLLIQFLIDFEARLAKVEIGQIDSVSTLKHVVEQGVNRASGNIGLFQTNTVTADKLIRSAAAIGRDTPNLATALARSEIDRLSTLLLGLSEHGVGFHDWNRDCLFNLTRNATESIDIVSFLKVEPGTAPAPWHLAPHFGGTYVDLLRHAARRNVRIRQLIVVACTEAVDEVTNQRVQLLVSIGIHARLAAGPITFTTTDGSIRDFALFDNTVSYEAVRPRLTEDEATPVGPDTRIVTRAAQVDERRRLYEAAWVSTIPLAEL